MWCLNRDSAQRSRANPLLYIGGLISGTEKEYGAWGRRVAYLGTELLAGSPWRLTSLPEAGFEPKTPRWMLPGGLLCAQGRETTL